MAGSKPFMVPDAVDVWKVWVGALVASAGVVLAWLLGDVTGVTETADVGKLAFAAGLSVLVNALRKWVSNTTGSNGTS